MKTQALRAVRVLKAAKAYDPFSFHWLMGRLHVGASDEKVKAEIMRRAKKWPPAVQEAAVTYALAIHRRNQRLYRQVTSGRFR